MMLVLLSRPVRAQLWQVLRGLMILLHITGVDGVDVVIGTSSFLRQYSHGKSIQYIIKVSTEYNIEYRQLIAEF